MTTLFSDITPFLEVAELGSFRKAADRLGVTPAAVSKAVARLEARLDTRLFSRSTRRVVLTPEGEIFAERCQAAAREIGAGMESLEETRGAATGVVTVTAPFVLGRFLAGALPELALVHDRLRVRLMLTDRRVDLVNERVDVAIRVGEPGETDLIVRRLATLDWATVAAPAYLADRGTPESPGDLPAHRCLTFLSPAGRQVEFGFEMDGAVQTVEVDGTLQFDEGELLADAALAGGGIAQVFSFMVADAVAEGRLVALFPDRQPPGPAVAAVMLRERGSTRKVRVLLDFLYERFSRF